MKRKDIKHKNLPPAEDENLSEALIPDDLVPERPYRSESESEKYLPKEDEMVDPEKDPESKNYGRRK